MKILLATKNKHKIEEMNRIIKDTSREYNISLELVSLNDFDEVIEPIEDGKTFTDNAIIKAKYYYDLFNTAVITDDSGLEVDALDGEPGIYSARYASNCGKNCLDSSNRKKLLEKMKGVNNRSAHFVCATVYYDGNSLVNSLGITNGKILDKEEGTNGFGYDPIFYSDDLEKPLGLASDDEKDKISHRGLALRELLCKLFDKKGKS